MTKFLGPAAGGWGEVDAGDPREAIEHRLVSEADLARVSPSPELRRCTLAALQEATPCSAPRSGRPGMLLAARAAAGGLILTSGLIAILLMTPGRPTHVKPAERLAIFSSFDAHADVGDKLTSVEATWEERFVNEARLVLNDAREAGQSLLSRLPAIPGTRSPSGGS